ncbi:WG repeat-containing protein [Tenacibaculum holothuriorum]|nr:WG repeat-containing protein [Tenacibaculum holothuriorum]
MFFLVVSQYAQTNEEIAGVYLRKSEESYNTLKVDKSLMYFEKALKLIDSARTAKTARLGSLIHYEKKNYKEAKRYAKKYFSLAKNKSSDKYIELLDLYVDMEEKIAKEEEEERIRIEAERKKMLELKRIDSLKTLWKKQKESLNFSFDTLYSFNKYGLALVKKDNKYGIIDDLGYVKVTPSEYENVKSFDGYFLFLDKKENPTKIFSYNSKTKEGYLLPEIESLSLLSTNYGKVMLPRGNSRIVFYPENSQQAIVFDLDQKKKVVISDIKELFKSLKKNDFIDRYKEDDLEIKIQGDWYRFGGHLGGNVYALFGEEDTVLQGYLLSNKQILKSTDYLYLGCAYKGKLEAEKNGEIYWIDNKGEEVSSPKDMVIGYGGETKVESVAPGVYQFYKLIKAKKYFINKDDKLETLKEFLRKNK